METQRALAGFHLIPKRQIDKERNGCTHWSHRHTHFAFWNAVRLNTVRSMIIMSSQTFQLSMYHRS